jgi:hypothetical protein
MSKYLYFRLVERNEHEGESWNFYVPYNQKDDKKMVKLIEKLNFGENWTIDKYSIPEDIVDILVEYDNSEGYMNLQNKVEDVVTLEQIEKFTSCKSCMWDLENGKLEWYKGEFSFDCSCEDEEESDYYNNSITDILEYSKTDLMDELKKFTNKDYSKSNLGKMRLDCLNFWASEKGHLSKKSIRTFGKLFYK